jgi:hypothetical protein
MNNLKCGLIDKLYFNVTKSQSEVGFKPGSTLKLDTDAYSDDEIAMLLEGERTGLVRPQLDANGRWDKPCRVVNGKLVLDEKVR